MTKVEQANMHAGGQAGGEARIPQCFSRNADHGSTMLPLRLSHDTLRGAIELIDRCTTTLFSKFPDGNMGKGRRLGDPCSPCNIRSGPRASGFRQCHRGRVWRAR